MGLDRRRMLVGTAACLSMGAAAHRSAHAQSQAAGSATTLRYVPAAALATLDPIGSTNYLTRDHAYMIYDTLFATDEHLRIQPQAVERWSVAAEGLAWTFTLRAGLVFHDGAPVRAADCVASLRRWAAVNVFGRTVAAVVDGYDAADDRSFTIRLKQPYPQLLASLGRLSNLPFILPERVAAADPARGITDTVGSGPFRFRADLWQPGQVATYERFEHYVPRQEPASWTAGGKVVKVGRVECLAIPDASTAAAALRQGEVDWWRQPPVDLVAAIQDAKGVTVTNLPFGLMLVLRFNNQQAPFDNVKVRQAVMMAVQQTDYMQAAVGDARYYTECKSFFTCGGPFASADGAGHMGGDMARAQAMLRDSGYAGEPVVLLAPADIPLLSSQSEITRDLLTRLGMTVRYEVSDWAGIVARRSNRGPVAERGWSAFHNFWSGPDMLDPAVNIMLRSNGGDAWFGWPNDPRIEALRTEWMATNDPARQVSLAQAMQAAAFESVPYVPTGYVQQPTAYRSSLRGLVICPIPIFWNVEVAA